MRKIILVDFSKVISPVGISRFLSSNLEKYLTINKEKIREIYKEKIGELVIGKYSIFSFLEKIKPFLKQEYSIIDLEKEIYKIPILDKKFLNFLLILKQEYKLILISDVYEELGKKLRIKLNKYFDDFIFSFEEKSKKSQEFFWQNLRKKLDFNNVKLFIDDKKENIDLAKKNGIDGFIFKNLQENKNEILKKVFEYKQNIILGAGASGILYGYFFKNYKKNDFIILEKENNALGLMQSFKLGNSYYDLGGHALHDKNVKIKNFLEKYGKIKHYKQKRKAFIDYKNIFIPFPFQLHLAYLPEKEKKECLEKFLETYVESKNKKAKNLEEYLKLKFGDGINKYFLKDYNQKIWKTKLDKIAINWNNRIYFENLDIFLKGYLEKNEENYGTNNFVNYPEKKGFEEYIKNFYNEVKNNISLNAKIKKIDYKNNLIFTQDKIYFYENIISTIPLNELIKLTGIEKNIEIFEFLSLQVIAILIKKIKEEKQRIYSSDKKYYFHKCVLNSNSSDFLRNQNEFIFQFENSFKNGKKIKKEKLIENYINFLKEKGFIKTKEDILQIDYKEIKYAYPIQTIEMLKRKEKLNKKFEKNNIFLLGRFGNWEYINFDKVIENTINLFNKKENENFII